MPSGPRPGGAEIPRPYSPLFPQESPVWRKMSFSALRLPQCSLPFSTPTKPSSFYIHALDHAPRDASPMGVGPEGFGRE